MAVIQKISNWLISQKESPILKNEFLNWTQVTKVVLLAYDNQLSNVVDFINACKQDGIYVMVGVIYDGKLELAPKPHFDHVILGKKQFSFFKIPKDDVIAKLSSIHPDVLINLGAKKNIRAIALSKMIAAKCKISNFQNSNFDLIIEYDQIINTSEYLKQVIVYLKMIKTTNNQ